MAARVRARCVRCVEVIRLSAGRETIDLLESKFRNYEASLKPRAELESEPGI